MLSFLFRTLWPHRHWLSFTGGKNVRSSSGCDPVLGYWVRLQVSSPSARINMFLTSRCACMFKPAGSHLTWFYLVSPFIFVFELDLKVLQLKRIKRRALQSPAPCSLPSEGEGALAPCVLALLLLNIFSFFPHTLTFHGIYISVYKT